MFLGMAVSLYLQVHFIYRSALAVFCSCSSLIKRKRMCIFSSRACCLMVCPCRFIGVAMRSEWQRHTVFFVPPYHSEGFSSQFVTLFKGNKKLPPHEERQERMFIETIGLTDYSACSPFNFFLSTRASITAMAVMFITSRTEQP